MSSPRETVGRWIAEAIERGQADVYAAKRREARYVYRRPMQMKYKELVHEVTVRDISDNGVGLLSSKGVTAGESIEIRSDEAEPWVPARVMHATASVGAFKLGVQFRFEIRTRQLRASGEDPPRVAESLLALANVMFSRRNYAGAQILIEECLRIRQKALPAGHWLIAMAENALGDCLCAQGHFAEAERALRRSFRVIRSALGAEDERTLTARQRMVTLYNLWGKPEHIGEFDDERR